MIVDDSTTLGNWRNREMWANGVKVIPQPTNAFRDFPNYREAYLLYTLLLGDVSPLTAHKDGCIVDLLTDNNKKITQHAIYYENTIISKSNTGILGQIFNTKYPNRLMQCFNFLALPRYESQPQGGSSWNNFNGLNLKPSNSLEHIVFSLDENFGKWQWNNVQITPSEIKIKDSSKAFVSVATGLDLAQKYIAIQVNQGVVSICANGVEVVSNVSAPLVSSHYVTCSCDHNMALYEYSMFNLNNMSDMDKAEAADNQIKRINKQYLT